MYEVSGVNNKRPLTPEEYRALNQRVASYSRKQHPREHAQLERKRSEAMSRPLMHEEVQRLLDMHWGGKPEFRLEQILLEEWLYQGIKEERPMFPNEAQKLLEVKDDKNEQKYAKDDLYDSDGLLKPMTPRQAADIYKVQDIIEAKQRKVNLLYCDIHSKAIWS